MPACPELAGLGPFAFGVLHGATGGWRVPLTVLMVWLIPETLVAWRAARPGRLGPPGPGLVPATAPPVRPGGYGPLTELGCNACVACPEPGGYSQSLLW
jgi:hypothetical protein